MHGEQDKEWTTRTSTAALCLMVPAAGFSSVLLSSAVLNRPGLRAVPITGGEAFAFAALWYWYLMSVGQEQKLQKQGLSAAAAAKGRGPRHEPQHHQVVWAARRVIEGIAIWNVAALMRGFVHVRRLGTADPLAAWAAQAAIRSSPLPTLRPFGIPAVVGMLVSTAFCKLRDREEGLLDAIPSGGV